ncbi:hypothetical protein BCR36DRAFT_463259, partial [Piromyces finnis]
GFSLIYGSILVKTYRIYKIFKMKRKTQVVKSIVMYGIVMGITSIHIIMLLLWIHFNKIKLRKKYTIVTEEEYNFCEIPKSEHLGYII